MKGFLWVQDMHLLAERCILKGLKAAGVVTGDVEDMLAARIGALFMPHGMLHTPPYISDTRPSPRH